MIILFLMLIVVFLLTVYNTFTLRAIEQDVSYLTRKGVKIMATLQELETQIAENTSVEESAIALIQGIAAQLESMKQDPVKIQAFIDNLNASADALAAAVQANTPVTPA